MLNGEFESAKVIYGLMPGLVPEPIGYGKYIKTETGSATYYYLSEFVHMDSTMAPDPGQLGQKLAELHRRSHSQSPTGKFGFHVTTCDGRIPHTVDWQDDWAAFFARLLSGICKVDQQTNGPWPELERAADQVVTTVVPRLLGRLTNSGRPIQPCILHGDLWEPNLATRVGTGDMVMYDASSFWGHNEMDLGLWRADLCSHLRSNYQVHTRSYLRHFAATEPVNEFDDRNRLYSLKGTLNYSAGHPNSMVRQT